MNKLLKTCLSFLFVFSMCLTLPVSVYADETDTEITDENTVQVESQDEEVEEEPEEEVEEQVQSQPEENAVEEVTEKTTDGVTVSDEDDKCTSVDLADSDTLFSDYVDEKLDANANGENVLSTGDYYLDDMGETYLEVYRQMDSYMSSVANGQRSYAWFEINANIKRTGDFSADSEEDAIANMRADARNNVIQVMVELLTENSPYEFYWFDKTEGYLAPKADINLRYATDYSYYTITGFQIGFTVSKDYALEGAADEYYADTTKTGATITAINTANSIVDQARNLDSYNKFLYFKNQVCDLTDYNDDAGDEETTIPYGNPWQLIWVFDNDPETKVVCEGYSKAYKYLCDLAGLTCYTISGKLDGGGHMWNIVLANDDKYYLVDLTNCDDDGVGYPDKMFMKGVDFKSVTEGFSVTTSEDEVCNYTYDTTYTIPYYSKEILTLSTTDYENAWDTEPTISLSQNSFIYTGEECKPAVTVSYKDEILTEGEDYTLTYSNNVEVGQATVTAEVTGDYEGTVSKKFLINPIPVDSSYTIKEIEDQGYTGKAIEPEITVEKDDEEMDASNYTVEYVNNLYTGTAKVYVTFKGNYTGTITTTFKIIPVLKSATNVSTGVTVKWNAVKGATKYAIYRKAVGGEWSKYLSKNITTTSYTDTTVASGTAYVYTVKAYVKGWSDYDDTGISIEYLAQPSISTVSNTNGGITLNWNAIEGATSYKVSRRVAGNSKWTDQWVVTDPVYTDTSAVNGTQYEYTIRAIDDDYMSSYNSKGTAIMCVSTPVLTKAAKCSKGGNKVYWKKVAGATRYAVYRKTATAKSWTRLTNTCTTNSYQDAKAKDGSVYYYTVRAYNTVWSSYNPDGVHN